MKEINNLYISDLDGTLLDNNATISKTTCKLINKSVDKGADFTVATARSLASVKVILADVKLNYPLILMNGVLIYDFLKKKYLLINSIEKSKIDCIINVLRLKNCDPFVYTIENDEMHTYYEKLSSKAMTDFYTERYERYNKSFSNIDNFSEIKNLNIIYFTLFNTYDILKPVYDEICKIDGLEVTFYQDNYTQELWYMEIFSHKASKKKAVKFIKDMLSPKKITCFGDNLNDIPMFEIADHAIAVGNAHQPVKAIANQIIGNNTDDSVAKFIYDAIKI